MRTNLFNFFAFFFAITLFAQRPSQSYGSIQKKVVEGRVIDNETNQGLEYAVFF